MTIAAFHDRLTVRPAPTDSDRAPAQITLEQALVLKRVTDTAWQVCDSRQPPHSPGYLLGFVEAVHDGVELMQLGDKFIWNGFPTMQDALAHVAGTAYITATERATGQLAWIG